ncbi:uncharacterized protein BX663DRAFT_509878 [Cokeromyces recurvatus]|uniref:uncharacterized protein n=1 Tax=Cokeromyces recurvatus TaxID=90255 RepID=UPI00222038D3|nr:uncharacterized protein BX663DRAFT_509878 [Cokeromyces recurvatus]KAI7902619.1 hypothetical protein BX663DRAFT_509878 [Cokeromyces recurvatus]
MIQHLSLILTLVSIVFAQQSQLLPATATVAQQPLSTTEVSTDGFNSTSNNLNTPQESWLQKNHRYVFIIVLVLLFLAIFTWYIIKSVCGMRKRLAAENQNHIIMTQNASGVSQLFSEKVSVVNDGFYKMPDYPGNQQQQQQQYMHRY